MTQRRNIRERVWDRVNLIGDIAAVVCIAVFAIALKYQADHLDDVASGLHNETLQAGNQHRQLVEGCNRLQILRVNENISHAADYRVFRVVLLESQAAEAAGAIPQAQRENEDTFLGALRQSVHSKTWTPLTDCAQAVNLHGVHYRSPAPVRFDDRMPPKSALTYPPGAFR